MSAQATAPVSAAAMFERFLCERSPPSRNQILLNLLAFVNDHNIRMEYGYQTTERFYQALKSLYMYDTTMPGSKLRTVFYCFNFSDFNEFDLFKRIVLYKCDVNAIKFLR